MPVALVEYEHSATENIANMISAEELDSLDSRIGQAMHRLLERYAPVPGAPDASARWSVAQRAAVAQEFGLEPAQMDQAHAMAHTIVRGEGAWAWDARQLQWQGNEVGLVHRGRLLRIDRLVQRQGESQDEGQWWVLDYKSTPQPQQQAELCAQLLGYRAAVVQAQPGHTVRAAFLTAQGTLIELKTA
jgi:ATP-dependent helicase/nuclease subunit A